MHKILNFIYWIIQAFQRLFDIKGRSCRREFWSFCLLIYGLDCLNDYFYTPEWGISYSILSYILVLFTISISIRRLHDINLSGVGYVTFLVITFILYCLNDYLSVNAQTLLFIVFFTVSIIVSLIFFIQFLLPGTSAANKYGNPHNYLNRDRAL